LDRVGKVLTLSGFLVGVFEEGVLKLRSFWREFLAGLETPR